MKILMALQVKLVEGEQALGRGREHKHWKLESSKATSSTYFAPGAGGHERGNCATNYAT